MRTSERKPLLLTFTEWVASSYRIDLDCKVDGNFGFDSGDLKITGDSMVLLLTGVLHLEVEAAVLKKRWK